MKFLFFYKHQQDFFLMGDQKTTTVVWYALFLVGKMHMMTDISGAAGSVRGGRGRWCGGSGSCVCGSSFNMCFHPRPNAQTIGLTL